jgi:hypothetical protein
MFLDVMGSDASVAALRTCAHDNKIRGGDPEPMSDEQFAIVVQRDAGCFHGFVLMGFSNMCRKSKRQLYFPTFCARFHGLSRQGVQIMSHFGCLMSITTYDRYQVQFLADIKEKNKYDTSHKHPCHKITLFACFHVFRLKTTDINIASC